MWRGPITSRSGVEILRFKVSPNIAWLGVSDRSETWVAKAPRCIKTNNLWVPKPSQRQIIIICPLSGPILIFRSAKISMIKGESKSSMKFFERTRRHRIRNEAPAGDIGNWQRLEPYVETVYGVHTGFPQNFLWIEKNYVRGMLVENCVTFERHVLYLAAFRTLQSSSLVWKYVVYSRNKSADTLTVSWVLVPRQLVEDMKVDELQYWYMCNMCRCRHAESCFTGVTKVPPRRQGIYRSLIYSSGERGYTLCACHLYSACKESFGLISTSCRLDRVVIWNARILTFGP